MSMESMIHEAPGSSINPTEAFGAMQAGDEVLVRPPAHPVPSLQGPFEESMVESVSDPSENDVPIDAVTRRTILLDSPYYQRVVAGRWKQKPGEKFHPLWKLVAQMSFGLHLLCRNMAKSEDEVMKILQAHVDDIDSFLERTNEDFDLAQSDMHERLRCLKLPLQHSDVFDRMLEDRNFRASILEGNEKIEHIVARTKRMLKDALKDVQKGFDATNVLEKYLTALGKSWDRETPEHEAVFVAMLGNVEGWRRAFMELHLHGNKLAGVLKKLIEVVAEMQRRAAAVSRNMIVRSQVTSHPSGKAALVSNGSVRSSQTQKPLPQAPARHRSTRRSSRSIKFLDDSARPGSASRSDPDQSVDSRPQSHESPQARSRTQTPNTMLSNALMSSNDASLEGTPGKDIDIGSPQPMTQSDIAIELPADVPEEVMRQAPVSIKNRLSYTLGLKPRDNTDHRVSSVYYPSALRDLLKISPSSNLMLDPNQAANRAGAGRSISPQTAQTGGTGSEADYFSAKEFSPTTGVITPESKMTLESGKTTPSVAVRNVTVTSPDLSSEQRNSSTATPALNSHPSVMAMASPPAELSGVIQDDRPQSRSRKPSESTLGEPGPEIADTESDSGTHHRVDMDVNVVPPGQPVLTNTTELAQPSQIASDPTMNSTAATTATLDHAPNPAPGVSDPLQSHSDDDEHEELPEYSPSDTVQSPMDEKQQIHAELDHTRATNQERSPTERPVEIKQPKQTIIAELEAYVPETPVAVSKPKQFSPVELDAPRQTFILPPRPPDQPRRPVEPQPKPMTVRERIAKMRAQAEEAGKLGMKPKDFRESKVPEPIEPLKVKLAKVDGKMVPVIENNQNKQSGKPGAAVKNVRLSQDVITNMIDQMSTTPAGSPTRERSFSTASSNSAQIRVEHSSKAFAPPGSAPAPPAPGGRAMVEPDFASAGQFEGERKIAQRSSKSSRNSKGPVKDALTNAGSQRNSSDNSSKSARNSSTRNSVSARGSGSDMLTAAGKDVLWFKGEGKGENTVDVASN